MSASRQRLTRVARGFRWPLRPPLMPEPVNRPRPSPGPRRVVHLVDHGAGPEPLLLARLATLLQQAPPDERHTVVLLGPQRLAHAAWLAGIRDAIRLGFARGDARFALPVLWRTLARLEPFDEACCWSASAEAACRWLRGNTRVSRASLADRDAPATPPANAVSTVSTDDAAPAERGHSRRHARRAWGVDHDRPCAIALLGDAPDAGDAYEAALAVGLTREALAAPQRHPDPRLIVRPDQRGRAHAQRMFDELGAPHLLIQDPRLATPWQVAAGLDAALILSPSPAATRWAHTAALPVVTLNPSPDPTTPTPTPTPGSSNPTDLRTLSLRLTAVLKAGQDPTPDP